MKRHLLLPLLCLALPCLLSGCYLLFLFKLIDPWDIDISITVSDLTEQITIGLAPAGTLDYGCGAQIDIDGNSATGDPVNGAELSVGLGLGGSPPVTHTGTVESLWRGYNVGQPHVSMWDEASSAWSDNEELFLATAAFDQDTLHLLLQSSVYPQFAANFRSEVTVGYYNSGSFIDDQVFVTGAGTVQDPAGDTSGVDVIDIVSVTVSYPFD
jgi:hypothetical protein